MKHTLEIFRLKKMINVVLDVTPESYRYEKHKY